MPRANARPSQSEYISLRQLRLHLRQWPATPPTDDTLKVILHGWLDLSATWQRVVDYLPTSWNIAAPDQRGFGLSENAGDTYWFYDYLADLDLLLEQISPDRPVDLIGHSMGSQVAALYAGVQPQRVRKLVALDGFYLPQAQPQQAGRQLRNWFSDLRQPPTPKCYPDLDTLAARIAKRQPGLDAAGALEIAGCWSTPTDDGQVRLLGDPRHHQRGPLLYRDEEAKTIFTQVTAPTLILDAGASHMRAFANNEIRLQRIACFQQRQHESIADAGHMLHFDAPQATAQAIENFLHG